MTAHLSTTNAVQSAVSNTCHPNSQSAVARRVMPEAAKLHLMRSHTERTLSVSCQCGQKPRVWATWIGLVQTKELYSVAKQLKQTTFWIKTHHHESLIFSFTANYWMQQALRSFICAGERRSVVNPGSKVTLFSCVPQTSYTRSKIIDGSIKNAKKFVWRPEWGFSK
jgi:hypothetical protein